MSRSVLFHVQYLLGIGHLQRSLRIAGALARDGVAVTLVNGGPPAAELTANPKVRLVQLEPVRARDASFALAGRLSDRGHRRAQQPRRSQRKASRRNVPSLAAMAKLRRNAYLEQPAPLADPFAGRPYSINRFVSV